MKFSQAAEDYWKGPGLRYLAEGNNPPSVEERVKAAFDAGVQTAHIQKANWDMIRLQERVTISFPEQP
jgi:hypothetical protein